jgi:MarR family transcriptional regulator, lower aerobic nicotinate degradation pathway regulator
MIKQMTNHITKQITKPIKKSAEVAVLENQPGYYIRRLQQIAVGLFMEETDAFGLTPVQYAALNASQRNPGLDQRSLARMIGFDTSTIGGVVDRLEARELIQRNASPEDRRVRLLEVTPEGAALLKAVTPAMLKAQDRILKPLPRAERAQFLRMIKTLVEANNEASRAPKEVA